MRKKSFSPPICLALSTLVVIVPVVFYWCRFGTTLSRNFGDWVEFSKYLSPFATLFSGCAIGILTWWLYDDRKAIEKERARLEKPLITFRRTRRPLEGVNQEHPFYEMINGGRSSALSCNVYIQEAPSDRKLDQPNHKFNLKLICYTLEPNGILDFSKPPKRVSEIAAVYEDIYGNCYTTICFEDKNKFYCVNKFPGDTTQPKPYDEYKYPQ